MRLIYLAASFLVNGLIGVIMISLKASSSRNFSTQHLHWLTAIEVVVIAISVLMLASLAWFDTTKSRKDYDILYVIVGGLSIPLWMSLGLLNQLQAVGRIAAGFVNAFLQLGPFLLVTGVIGLLLNNKKS